MLKYVLILFTLTMGFSKGKIEALIEKQGSYEKINIPELYSKISDIKFFEELDDLKKNEIKHLRARSNQIYQYGLEKEILKRGTNNKEFRKYMLSYLEGDNGIEETQVSIVKNIWKVTPRGESITEVENVLRDVFRKKKGAPKLRNRILRQLNYPSEENKIFHLDLVKNSKNQKERMNSLRSLGKIGYFAHSRSDKPLEENIIENLKYLKNQGKLTLAELTVADVMTRTENGREYFREELAKEAYKDWDSILYTMKKEIPYDYFKKLFKKETSRKQSHAKKGALVSFAESMIENMPETIQFDDDQDKILFLEIREMAFESDASKKVDDIVENFLKDKNPDVRMAAIKAVHFAFKNNGEILKAAYKEELDKTNKQFLEQYGYADL